MGQTKIKGRFLCGEPLGYGECLLAPGQTVHRQDPGISSTGDRSEAGDACADPAG